MRAAATAAGQRSATSSGSARMSSKAASVYRATCTEAYTVTQPVYRV